MTVEGTHFGGDSAYSQAQDDNGTWFYVAGGGAIANASGATATVSDSVIDGTSVAGYGGGIENDGTLTLERTVVHNTEGVLGGGLYNAPDATAHVTNSTFAYDQADGQWPGEDNGCGPAFPGYGGAIDNMGGLTLYMSDVIDNYIGLGEENAGCADDAGGRGAGIYNDGTETIGGSILASNTLNSNPQDDESGPDCDDANPSGSTSGDYNIVDDTSSVGTDCGMFTGTHDQTRVDPQLNGLGYNGGEIVGQSVPDDGASVSDQQTTLTALPKSGSPAIDAVPSSVCTSFLGASPTDERGVPRPQGSACDAGSIEVSAPALNVANQVTFTCTDSSSPCTFDAADGLLAGDTGLSGTTLIAASEGCPDQNACFAPFPGTVETPTGAGGVTFNADGSWSFDRDADDDGDGFDEFEFSVIDLQTNESAVVSVILNEITPSTTTLGSSGTPSPVGSQVTYTATITPTYGDSASPGGDDLDGTSVTFSDGGTQIPTCVDVPVYELDESVTAYSWQAACTVTYSTAGSHVIQAAFSGGDAGATWDPSTSNTVTQVVGAASKLAITTEPPGDAAVGSSFTVGVSVENAAGDVVGTDSSAVALALTPGTGAAGAALTCTGGDSHAATDGIATFECSIDRAGTGYTLTASDGTLTDAVTDMLTITSPPPPPPPKSVSAKLASVAALRNGVGDRVSCVGVSGQTCALTETLTTVTAGARHKRKTVVVGSAAVKLAAGKSATIDLSLTSAGGRLLKASGKLKVTLTVALRQSGRASTIATRTLTIKYHERR